MRRKVCLIPLSAVELAVKVNEVSDRGDLSLKIWTQTKGRAI
ncbi:hypothetical protein [Neobacillus kokaensis]|uniref:Uncharacterized protein n=1 Tax=Neobacillus kokaensis TaxID=2759023 RepID=A0ABQ3NA13_9BACI|nr:hypothetical protein [Neobacillus kokaensis]GHI00768.1 hypothetical protein AM1BK_43100 [Neobacillus kokaensis]